MLKTLLSHSYKSIAPFVRTSQTSITRYSVTRNYLVAPIIFPQTLVQKIDDHFGEYKNPIIPPKDKTVDAALQEMWKELLAIAKDDSSTKEATQARNCLTALLETKNSKTTTAIFFPNFPQNETAAIYLSAMIARFFNYSSIVDTENEIESVARISNPNSDITNVPPHQDYTLDEFGRYKVKLLFIIGSKTDKKVETYSISAQEIWDNMSVKSQQILSQPLFQTKPKSRENQRFSIFFEEDNRLGLTYCNFYRYDSSGKFYPKNEISKALEEFFETIDELVRTTKGAVIKEGSALAIMNNNAIHGTKLLRTAKEKTSGNRKIIVTSYAKIAEADIKKEPQDYMPTR